MSTTLPPGVTRTKDPGDREAVRLHTPGTARHEDEVLLSVLGAQVLSWHHRGRDVLWTASRAEYTSGKPVRGGIPLVFPWFGDHPTDPRLPAHGFARTLTWHFVDAPAPASIVLATQHEPSTLAMWPHAFALRLAIELSTELRLCLTIENRDKAPLQFEAAMHTYFAVGDVHSASVHGLEGVDCTEHAREPERGWDANAPLRFRAETDRVFQSVGNRIELRAPAQRRTTILSTRNARSAIVWNPWPAKTARLSQMVADDWTRFLCIESANVRQHAVRLAPGQSSTMELVLAAEDAAEDAAE